MSFPGVQHTMARLPPSARNFCSVLLLVSSLTNVVFAQLSQDACGGRIAGEYYGLYDRIQNNPSNDTMKWCPWWAGVCGYVYRNCRPAVSCDFTNYDPKITTRYDPGSTSSLYYFQGCSSCDVQASLTSPYLPSAVRVPTQGHRPVPSDMLPPGEPPKDMNTQRSWVSRASSSATIALILGGIIGSLIAARTNKGASASKNAAYAAGAGVAAIPIVTANVATSLKDVIVNSEPFIDAVTLLMQFQYISLTGFLSVTYPAIYRFFSFNFGWANLIIPSEKLKAAAQRLANRTQCLRDIGSLRPGSNGLSNMSGMDGIELRYGVNRATLGGVVYISAIILLAVALVFFVLAAGTLRILNIFMKSKKLEDQIEAWPGQACNIGLRVINWFLAAVATFAFYQFVAPCSSRDLIAFGAVEFVIIIVVLLVVTILIVKTAKREGAEALYPLSDDEESKYSRKWGTLYSNLKPTFYWFFILDYIFVLTRSIIIGAGQGSGVGQAGALIALETIILLALAIKRPYKTFAGNAFQMFSALRRLFSSAALIVFWQGFNVLIETKRVVGMIIMIVESSYSAALFVFLIFNFVAATVKWFTQRKERKQAEVASKMHHTDSYVSHKGPEETKGPEGT